MSTILETSWELVLRDKAEQTVSFSRAGPIQSPGYMQGCSGRADKPPPARDPGGRWGGERLIVPGKKPKSLSSDEHHLGPALSSDTTSPTWAGLLRLCRLSSCH